MIVESSVAETIGVNLEIYLASNMPVVQILNSDTGTYTPDWSSNPLMVTPTVLVNNTRLSLTDPRLTITWERRLSGVESLLDSGETTRSGVQTVSANIATPSISYICQVSYQESGVVSTRSAELGFTLSTVSDGADGKNGEDGKNAPTCILSSDSITFAANANGQVAAQAKTINVIAYSGTTKVTPAVGTIIGAVSGMTITKGNATDNELPITITISSNSTLGSVNQTNGTIQIPITYPVATTLQVHWAKVNTGVTGAQGIQGTAGSDGKTTYFHVKYSTVANPTTAEQMTETPSTYIGTYVDHVENDSTDPAKYTWCQFQGSQGIPGTNGSNGQTSYLHIKYSDDGGSSFTSNNGETVGTWIGQYVDFTEEDSTAVGSYKWSKIKGDDGADGKNGEDAVLLTLYTPSGSVFVNGTGTLIVAAAAYAGSTDITSAASYTWQKYESSSWTNLSETSNTLSVSGSSVSGIGIYRCIMTYGGNSYTDVVTLTDKTDNYQASISSSAGDLFVNGLGSSTLVCHVYQNGKESDLTGNTYTYTWSRVDKAGNVMDSSSFASGKTITVTSDNVEEITTFICEISVGVMAQFTISVRNDIVTSATAPSNPNIDALWLDTSDEYKNILKRWNGTEWIETTLSREEVTNIYSTLTEYDSEIEQQSQSITLRVTQEEMKSELENKADADWVTQRLESIIKQTAEDITQQFNQAKEFTVESTSALQNFITEVRSYQRFNADGQELGVLNSPFIAKLGNTKLSFLQDGSEIAYISNNKLYITEAQVTSKLSIGTDENGFFEWITTDAGLGMKWKSGTQEE